MSQLTLYTTLGCHLCERLEALLASLHRGEYRLVKVEISEDEALMACYGVRIPVLVDAAGDELDRGFEPSRLAAWLAERRRLDDAAWRRLQASELGPEETVREEQQVPTEQRPGGRRPGGRRYLG